MTKSSPESVPRPGDPRFLMLLDNLSMMHMKKSADYGTDDDVFANLHASARFGISPFQAALVRVGDKVGRLEAYCANGRLENEGLRDTLLDLASYALIALVMHEEETSQ